MNAISASGVSEVERVVVDLGEVLAISSQFTFSSHNYCMMIFAWITTSEMRPRGLNS
jgi:hypothetical protein